MKIVFFGGVKGVGKSTLLSWLEKLYKDRFEYIDPGELFRRYHYEEKILTTEEVEELIVKSIEEAPSHSIMVVHWHYAVWRPTGFIPQISFPRLRRIAHNPNIELVFLLSVEASVESIYERRLKESGIKSRPLSFSSISEEAAADEDFLMRHRAIFSEAIGDNNVTVVRFQNEKLKKAEQDLAVFFERLLA